MDERRTDAGNTTIIERKSSGGTWAIAIVLLVAILLGAWLLLGRTTSESRKDAAVIEAAESVGAAADKVGDAVPANK